MQGVVLYDLYAITNTNSHGGVYVYCNRCNDIYDIKSFSSMFSISKIALWSAMTAKRPL